MVETVSIAEQISRQLIGQPGSRWRLPTPALVVDLDSLDANIRKMAARAKAAGVALRPHAKTHKSAFIAHRQIEAGAVGLCCAKLGEAEALAAQGIRKLLVTSPTASEVSAKRSAALAQQDDGFALVVDHIVGVDLLQAAASVANVTIRVLIDVDVGLARTGVPDTATALALARRISASSNLRLVGVQGYGGHWQHFRGAQVRHDAVKTGMVRLTDIVNALRADGHACPIVTGGGTGTFHADVELGVLNELQPGSYIYMDNEYAEALSDDEEGAFATSLFVQAQIISANAPGWVTVDAGLKAFATDGPIPRPMTAPFVGLPFFYFGDEHGGLGRPSDGSAIVHGQRVEFKVPHCDPTVDRYDYLHFVKGDQLVGVERIEAARRSQ